MKQKWITSVFLGWYDIILIAPTTANTISKLANGNSDDLASTVTLASNKNFIAPAMNVRMWEHLSTKQNIAKLKTFNYKLIGPVIGDMACGNMVRKSQSQRNSERTRKIFYLKTNNNLKAIVTAGPTNEYIDPVRFITNKSSGKQGYSANRYQKRI